MWIEGLSSMITCPIPSRGQQMRMRPRARVVLFAVGLFALLELAVSLFVHPATARAYDGKYYSWCKDSLGQKPEVCCVNAGGEWSDENCYDPAVLHPIPTPVPTVTQQVLPPVIVAPPA
jgi:hypothetical protein